MKKLLALFLLSLSLGCTVERAQSFIVNIPSVQNSFRWDTPQGKAYVASQPSQESFAYLSKAGVKTVINLSGVTESSPEEQAWALERGLEYVHIPVRPEELDQVTIDHFISHLGNAEIYPVFIHCSTGNRAALMMALFEIQKLKVATSLVVDKAKDHGLTQPELIDLIKRIGLSSRL